MKRGFTLIELMVVVAVSTMVVGIGVISVSSSLYRQRVQAARTSLISSLRLARNYAVTSQSPSGYSNQLDYVSVNISTDGNVSASAANLTAGVGTSYFSKNISEDEVKISSGTLLFSVPEGKILSNPTTPAEASYVLTVGISSVEGPVETATVQVDAGGKIW